MKFGDYTLPSSSYPTDMTEPQPFRGIATTDTLGGTSVFSWGVFKVGMEITLTWNVLSRIVFHELDRIYQRDEEILWVCDVWGKSYQVQITSLGGKLLWGRDLPVRTEVEMKLIIVGVN